MSFSITPPPVPMPSIRVGEIDSRYMDCTLDLGPVGDSFPSTGAISVLISRQDANPTTSGDLQLASGLSSGYATTLDSSKLIPTFWYSAPSGSIGNYYNLTLVANKTTQGRLFKRDWLIYVAPFIG